MPRQLTKFAAELTAKKIKDLADEYDYGSDPVIVKNKGFLIYDEFFRIACWKSKRPIKKYEKNSPELAPGLVEALTKIAFSAENEETRIITLLKLDGVGYPVASTLLHFGFKEEYPIIDRMALKSLWGIENPSYTFKFWWEYVETCRKIAKSRDVSVRTLDKALWVHRDSN